MATITPLSSGRGLPDLAVVEFACLIALMRLGPKPPPLLLETLSEWFGQDVRLSDIQPFVRRLIHQKMLAKDRGGSLRPLPEAEPPTAACYSAMLRIVGAEFQRALHKGDPPLIDHILGKVREERAREDAERQQGIRPKRGPKRNRDDDGNRDED